MDDSLQGPCMTYSAFLALFLLVPLLLTAAFTRTLQNRGMPVPSSLRAWPVLPVLAGHAVLAVLYTTPWDNYLVATQVWWYDKALVSGLVIGFVPLEEYLFFVAQTILVGLWTLLAARLTGRNGPELLPRPYFRLWSTLLVGLVGGLGAYLLASRQVAGTYLGLELVWAAVPLAIQLSFGADILWHYRAHIFTTLIPAVAYFSIADAIAIRAGTWTISPLQSSGILVGGVLPVEEMLFFLLTTAMVISGVTLMLSRFSHERAGRPLFKGRTVWEAK